MSGIVSPNCKHSSQSISSLIQDFVGAFGFDTDEFEHFRLKLLIFVRNESTFKNSITSILGALCYSLLSQNGQGSIQILLCDTLEWFRSG